EPLGEQALDVALELEGVGRMRANLYRAQGRIHGAIRLLPRTIPRLDSLGLPLDISDWGRFPNGLVLVGGATGSGKSTTMAALTLRALQSTPQVAITIEEPIEFQFDGASHQSIIRQREVGRDVSDFHRGLREALREDPDLIVVGEMRDPESISLALTAAETGHLVFTTLHSRSAASVVERIVDSYPPLRQQQIRVQLADSLRAVLSQRLLPHKSEPRRVLVAEVLRVTTNVAALIREGKTAQLVSAMQSGRSEGMLPLERCLADRVADGSISLDTARGAANDRQVLDHYLRAR
ncbi:MAG: PilT/PilU family type 4a pilus ATPase, partial [Myxococcales bacterium]|nr:PilT/PilU family type 4a pilus ATPase [Myxococcales bacterium]